MGIECARYDLVMDKLDKLAMQWASKKTMVNEITRVELLYFFLLVLNPDMNWVIVDFLLQGSNRKGHAHLIAAPKRLLRNRNGYDKNGYRK